MLVAERRKLILDTIDELTPDLIKMSGSEVTAKIAIIKRKVKKASHAKLDKYDVHLDKMKETLSKNIPLIDALKAELAKHRASLDDLNQYITPLEALVERQAAVDAEQREINRALAIIDLQMAPAEKFG